MLRLVYVVGSKIVAHEIIFMDNDFIPRIFLAHFIVPNRGKSWMLELAGGVASVCVVLLSKIHCPHCSRDYSIA